MAQLHYSWQNFKISKLTRIFAGQMKNYIFL